MMPNSHAATLDQIPNRV